MDQNSGFTRREIITAAASLAIPTIIPEGVIGRKGRPGANDRIIFGHIGLNGMGSAHIVPDACAAICDVDDNVLARIRPRIKGDPLVTRDFRRVLDRKDIDAVTIGTPDHWHAIMTVMACQAGKDVYSEKPVCKTVEEARAMLNAARYHKRIVQIGTQGRSNSQAFKAAEFVQNGGIGTVKRVDIWHPENFKGSFAPISAPPPTLDWDMWLGPARWAPYTPDIHPFNFRWYMDYGEGFIRDRGNHALSTMNWIIGNDDYDGLVECEATGKVQCDSRRDAPYAMDVRWYLPGRDLTITWSQPGVKNPRFPGEWGATYTGTNGDLVVLGGDGGCSVEPKALQFQVPPGGKHLYLHPIQGDDALARHHQNWYDCIRTRKLPVADIGIARKAILLCIVAVAAYKLGRKVTFNIAEDRFVNDPEADRLLSTPYRAPWKL
jgi:predicted dehydrogenase